MTRPVDSLTGNQQLSSSLPRANVQIVLRIAAIVLVIEFMVMLFLALPLFQGIAGEWLAAIDAVLLVTLSTPVIYYLIVKPFMVARDESNRFMWTVMESLSHPFYVIDAKNYHILYANPATSKGQDCSGMTCHMLTHHSERPCDGEHTCPLEEVKRTRKPVQMEHIHYDDQGREINVEVYGHPILDRHGEVVQMIEYSLNVTARKQAEAELVRRTTQELIQSERMAALGDQVAGFTHDLSTPVSVARGAATLISDNYRSIEQLMQQDEVTEAQLMDRLAAVNEAAILCDQNLRHAVDMISSMKRISIDQTSAEVRSFSLYQLLTDTVGSLSHQFKHTSITTNVDCDKTITLTTVPGVLVQIVTNLLNNSLKHAFRESKDSGSIEITAWQQGNEIGINYFDNGAGMEESIRSRVFERFFTTARESGGNGVGLYTSYVLVTETLGGNISCISAPGEGAHFQIRFPLNRNHRV